MDLKGERWARRSAWSGTRIGLVRGAAFDQSACRRARARANRDTCAAVYEEPLVGVDWPVEATGSMARIPCTSR